MKKLFWGILGVVIAAMSVYLYSSHNESLSLNSVEDKPVVKIGAILPLTGGMPSMGDAGKRGPNWLLKN